MATSIMTTTQTLLRQAESSEPRMTLIQHNILQFTLSAPGLMMTIFAIIISIHILKPSLCCTLLLLTPFPWIVYNDYINFINLGPGGTPSTFPGYLKITCLRFFALPDPYTPASIREAIYPKIGLYQAVESWIPARYGPRPKIVGIAPQRQLDQPGSDKMYHLLRAALTDLATTSPANFRIAPSCFEKKGLALFAQNLINQTCKGEIVHVHDSDRAMHLNLHPADAKIVLEKGWGERHPLARGGWMKQYVPKEFMMVYAPRDLAELGVVFKIIEAAGYWVCGGSFSLKVDGETFDTRRFEGTSAEFKEAGMLGMICQ